MTQISLLPVLCRINRPLDVRVLGWCADEKVWKCGRFFPDNGVTYFQQEGLGFIYGEHEISHWIPLPDAPKTPPASSNEEHMLHYLWSLCVGKPFYQKDVWRAVEIQLQNLRSEESR